METLTIDSAKPFSLDLIQQAILQNWPVEVSNADTLIVHGAGSRAYLHVEIMPEAVGMHRLLLDYFDVELAKSLLVAIADNPALIVDNDFGTILPGSEFVARCKADEGWDWRRPPRL